MAENDGIIIPLVLDGTEALGSLKDIIDSLTQTGAISDDTASKWKAAQQAMANATDDTAGSVDDLNDSFKSFLQNLAGGALRQGAQDMQTLGSTMQDTSGKIKTLSGQIADNTNQLAKMLKDGQQASSAFKTLENETVALNKAMQEVRDRIVNASRELNGLKTASGALNGLSSIVEGAGDAMSLFGTETEESRKKIEKIVLAIKLSNTVLEVANQIREKAKAAMAAEETATKAATAATELFGAASEAAWGAATAGITVLVAAIIGAIAYFNDLGKEESERIKHEEDLDDVFGKQNDKLEAQIQLKKILGSNANKEEIEKLKNETELAKKHIDDLVREYYKKKAPFGASSEDIYDPSKDPMDRDDEDFANTSKSLPAPKNEDEKKIYDQIKAKEALIIASNEKISAINTKSAIDNENFSNEIEYRKQEVAKHGIEKTLQIFDDETKKRQAALEAQLRQLEDFDKADEARAILKQERAATRKEIIRKYNLDEERKDIGSADWH